MILVLSLAAGAHVPHEVVGSLGATSGLDPGDWFLLAPKEGMHLLHSGNQGLSWQMIGGDPTVDELLQVVLVGQRVVARSESRLWWSDDVGVTWESTNLPATISGMLGGDELLLVGDGIWSGEPEALELEEEGFYVSIGAGRVAVSSSGEIYRKDATWRKVAELGGAKQALWDGVDLYVVGRGDGLFRYDGEWTDCGLVENGEVYSLATDGVGGLLAGSRDYAPYYSSDRCESWDLRAPPDKVEYQNEGAAEGPQEAYPVLVAAGERWVVAGWFGYWHSEDAGKTWLDSRILPPDFIRGLAFSGPDRVYKGGYSYGVAWTEDDGGSFRAPNMGLPAPNVQDVLPGAGDTVYAVVNHLGWTSLDGGESWSSWRSNTQTGGVARVEVLPDGGLWILGRSGHFISDDNGESAAALPALAALLGDGITSGMSVRSRDGAVELCLGSRSPDRVLCSEDRGSTWGVRFTGEGEGRLVLFAAAADGLWLNDAAGLHHVGDQDRLVPLPEGTDVDYLTVADDGSIFFSTLDARVYGMLPGAADWRSYGAINATIDHISPSPQFSKYPRLLLASHDGVWEVEDVRAAEPVLSRWGQWERVDAGTGFAFWSPRGPAELEDPEAAFEVLHEVGRGNMVRVWVRGSSLEVRGRVDRGAQVVLRLDGEALMRLGGEPSNGVHTLWAGSGLAEGWHLVELVGVEDGFWLDTVDGFTGGASNAPEPDEESSCGCKKGGAGLLLFVGALWRRRRLSTIW